MKVLFIGGTGNISASVSRLAVERGIDLYLLNRAKRSPGIPGATLISGDITDNAVGPLLRPHTWDAVVDWIAYHPDDVERDFSLFNGKTKQYIFISSASAYRKPLTHPVITESTPLANPFWEYSRRKIACELNLNRHYREDGFPVTIVRPSHTYDTVIPIPIGGWTEYTAVDRIRKGKKIIVHGDGTSLWTVTHAEDFAQGFIGLIGHQPSVGEAFHITSDEILTWDQIHQAVAAAAGGAADIVHIPSDVLAAFNPELRGTLIGDKAGSVIFDNTKIKRFVPGYTATIPFIRGIRQTIAWFEADPARQVVREETNRFIDTVIDRFEKAFAQ